jgi:hypothetical protein
MARIRQNKPIIETDKPNGKPIKYWRTAKAAAEFYKFGNQIGISYNVNGITKQVKGHFFRFATVKEIVDYEEILRRQETVANANPIATEPAPLINIPAETIPDVVQKPEPQQDSLTPFERLLQKSKKKFNENSD